MSVILQKSLISQTSKPEETGGEGGGQREGVAPLLKSRDPHLAGGDKNAETWWYNHGFTMTDGEKL